MNRVLAASSCLFLLPLWLAFLFEQETVALATLLCFVTSVANHCCETPPLRTIDIIVVNLAGLCFTTDALLSLRKAGYALVVLVGAATLAYYAYTKLAKKADVYHAGVHVLSNVGICIYILAGAFE